MSHTRTAQLIRPVLSAASNHSASDSTDGRMAGTPSCRCECLGDSIDCSDERRQTESCTSATHGSTGQAQRPPASEIDSRELLPCDASKFWDVTAHNTIWAMVAHPQRHLGPQNRATILPSTEGDRAAEKLRNGPVCAWSPEPLARKGSCCEERASAGEVRATMRLEGATVTVEIRCARSGRMLRKATRQRAIVELVVHDDDDCPVVTVQGKPAIAVRLEGSFQQHARFVAGACEECVPRRRTPPPARHTCGRVASRRTRFA